MVVYFIVLICYKKYELDDIKDFEEILICEQCNAIIKPNIVLYGEPLENINLWKAKEAINNADYLIVIGSSLTVESVASLIHDFIAKNNKKSSKRLFIINKGETPYDYFAIKYDDDICKISQVISDYISTLNEKKKCNQKKL